MLRPFCPFLCLVGPSSLDSLAVPSPSPVLRPPSAGGGAAAKEWLERLPDYSFLWADSIRVG